MFEVTLQVNELQEVYELSKSLGGINCDMDLMTEHRRFVVDAKSLLGILSLDLSKPLVLKAYTDDKKVKDEIMAVAGRYGFGRGHREE